jgi:hypothetical protein
MTEDERRGSDIMRIHYRAFAGCLWFAAAAWLSLCPVGHASAQNARSTEEMRRELREKTRLAQMPIAEAARQYGKHYVKTLPMDSWTVISSLEALARVSDAVVVGEVVSGFPILSEDQTYIQTVSTFRVIEAPKGTVEKNQWIKVVTVGGRMTFADGSSAEVIGLEVPKPGARYVFFLETMEKYRSPEPVAADLAGTFVPKLGPQGVFELRSDGVKAQGRNIDTLKQVHDRESVATFIGKVRKAGAESKGQASRQD